MNILKPYNLFALAGIILLLLSFLVVGNKYEQWRYMISGEPMPLFIIIFIIGKAILLVNIAGGIIKQVVKNKDHRTTL